MKNLLLFTLGALMCACQPKGIESTSDLWGTSPIYKSSDSTTVDAVRIISFKGEHFDGIIPTTIDGYEVREMASPKRGVGMFAKAKKDTSFVKIDASHAKYLTTIGESTFAGCKYVTELILNDNIMTLTSGAFADCKSLKNITWGKNINYIGDAAFYNCDGLTEVIIPSKVDTIGEFAFYASANIEKIVFNKNVSYIGMRAFANCGKYKEINLPKSLTYIGEKAFLNAKLLSEITIPAQVTEIGDKAFLNCKALQKLTLKNKNGIKIAKQTFASTPIATMETATIYYPKEANYPEMDIWDTFKARWIAQ